MYTLSISKANLNNINQSNAKPSSFFLTKFSAEVNKCSQFKSSNCLKLLFQQFVSITCSLGQHDVIWNIGNIFTSKNKNQNIWLEPEIRFLSDMEKDKIFPHAVILIWWIHKKVGNIQFQNQLKIHTKNG